MMFQDESHKVFVGRLLKPDEIEPWVLAQNMGSSPANRVCHHHTYIPTKEQWKGLKSLTAIFRYYERKGWPKGVGPHFFNAPEGIYVATHPRHDGIGVAGHNHRVIHIENVGNYDKKPLNGQMLANLHILNRALSKNPGIKVNRSTHFFHRDHAPKTCPGTANTKELLIAVPAPKKEAKPVVTKYQRFTDVPKSHWAYKEIEAIAQAGIMIGSPNSTFQPDRPVTRAQVAVIVARLLDNIHKVTKEGGQLQ